MTSNIFCYPRVINMTIKQNVQKLLVLASYLASILDIAYKKTCAIFVHILQQSAMPKMVEL